MDESPIDDAAVDDYRLTMAARVKCGICGDSRWRAFGSSLDGQPTRLTFGTAWPDGTPVKDHGFAVIGSACVNCGHIRLFVADLPPLNPKADADPGPQE